MVLVLLCGVFAADANQPSANDVGSTYRHSGSQEVNGQGFADPAAITIPWRRYPIHVADASRGEDNKR